MADILRPDLCIIGAGSGGLTAAAAALAVGGSVVLIEANLMGGDCLNTGCVPSKSLLAAAKAAASMRRAPRFGVDAGPVDVAFPKVHDHVRGVIAGIAPHDSAERFEALGAIVIRASARFLDKRRLEAGGKIIMARRYVVATGSRAAVPPIPGLETVPFLTNESVFDLSNRPAHLLVIGGGPIGLELGQAFRRLGSEVTVLESKRLLSGDDLELTDVALRALASEGLVLRSGVEVLSAQREGRGVSVTVRSDGTEEALRGSHLLVAIGRSPNTEELGLDAARIRHDGSGIKVNKGLRTSNRRVYAIGDVVAGGLRYTHAASYQAGLVVRSALFNLPVRENRAIIPHVTFTDPEVAQVGLTETEAQRSLGQRFRVLRWPFAENDRARTALETEGLVKVITDHRGKILGAGIVGAHAGELISLFSLAVSAGLEVKHFAAFVAPYPTLSEVAKRVAFEFYREKLDNPWLARSRALVRFLP